MYTPSVLGCVWLSVELIYHVIQLSVQATTRQYFLETRNGFGAFFSV